MNKFRNHLGEILLACFGVVAAARFIENYSIFFLLMAVRDCYAAYCFTIRKDADRTSPLIPSLVAYGSSALPLFYFCVGSHVGVGIELTTNLLIICGFTLATFATIDLRDRFGVAPANRGRTRRGIYRFISHPMYFGYLIAEFGLVLSNPANLMIYAASAALYAFRIRSEERILVPDGTGTAASLATEIDSSGFEI